MFEIGNISITVTWRDILDVSLVTIIFYRLILLVRGTRAVSVIYGLLLVVIFYFISDALGLYTLNWLLANFLGSLFLVIIILFQSDIRKALSEVGAGGFWRRGVVQERTLDEIIAASAALARSRIGALIVLEKNVPLGDVVERGVEVKGKISKELLTTIFYPNTSLHDGAVIVAGGRIAAAGCILPLATGLQKSDFGTRHRAAIGITQESDAVAVVVSEERGAISVAIGGKLTTALDEVRLKRVLQKVMAR